MLKITIEGVHTSIGEDLDKYVIKKIGKLDKYIQKSARGSAHAKVFLKEFQVKNKKQCTCEVIMHLPHEEFVTKETTMNIFAAVDIVDAKLKNHLRRHSEKPRMFVFLRHAKRKNV
jgi:ribosomal subunit interface protein